MMDNERHLYYSKTELLKLGWTDTMITKYLPPPLLADNRFGSKTYLYLKDDVQEIMDYPDVFAQIYENIKAKSARKEQTKAAELNNSFDFTELKKHISAERSHIEVLKTSPETLNNAVARYDKKDTSKEYAVNAIAYIIDCLTFYDNKQITACKNLQSDAALLIAVLLKVSTVFAQFDKQCKYLIGDILTELLK